MAAGDPAARCRGGLPEKSHAPRTAFLRRVVSSSPEGRRADRMGPASGSRRDRLGCGPDPDHDRPGLSGATARLARSSDLTQPITHPEVHRVVSVPWYRSGDGLGRSQDATRNPFRAPGPPGPFRMDLWRRGGCRNG